MNNKLVSSQLTIPAKKGRVFQLDSRPKLYCQLVANTRTADLDPRVYENTANPVTANRGAPNVPYVTIFYGLILSTKL